MIRTKQVVISRIAGARLITVSSSITCSVEASPCGLVHCCGPPTPGTTTELIESVCANANPAQHVMPNAAAASDHFKIFADALRTAEASPVRGEWIARESRIDL